MPKPSIRHVTDAESLKAIVHPLRGKLLAALRIDGPATASELARRLGESSGSTSYHLRQLARFGFIEEDDEQPNARDRRWRAKHRYTSWRDADFVDDPEGRETVRAIRMRQVRLLEEQIEQFHERLDCWAPGWLEHAGISDDVIRLAPEALGRLTERILELAREYAVPDGTDDAELVTLVVAGFPRPATGDRVVSG